MSKQPRTQEQVFDADALSEELRQVINTEKALLKQKERTK